MTTTADLPKKPSSRPPLYLPGLPADTPSDGSPRRRPGAHHLPLQGGGHSAHSITMASRRLPAGPNTERTCIRRGSSTGRCSGVPSSIMPMRESSRSTPPKRWTSPASSPPGGRVDRGRCPNTRAGDRPGERVAHSRDGESPDEQRRWPPTCWRRYVKSCTRATLNLPPSRL